jgi:uncharacterized membrane protein HdeD (DUF308 family)
MVMLENAVSKIWWMLLMRGILAISFGVLTFARSGLTLAALVLFFGAFAFIEGVLAVVAAIRIRELDDHWWVPMIEGSLGIVIAVLTFTNPLITALVLLCSISAWALVTGALRVVAGIRLRQQIKGEFWMILGGLVSMAFGIFTLAYPFAGALALLAYIGTWATLTGLSLVSLSIRLRMLTRTSHAPKAPVEAPAHGQMELRP